MNHATDTHPSTLSTSGPQLLVCNRWEAARWCHSYESVLSVFGPWWHCDWGHDDHLIVEFEDRVRREEGGPTLSQIDEILTWASQRLDRRILVHCKAGQSRSTAAAVGIAVLAGMAERDAFEHVFASCRPEEKVATRPFIPNRLVLTHIDTLLGTRLVSAWHSFEPQTWAA
mgnify:CR=1 FL=1